jgi:hypothetical protein
MLLIVKQQTRLATCHAGIAGRLWRIHREPQPSDAQHVAASILSGYVCCKPSTFAHCSIEYVANVASVKINCSIYNLSAEQQLSISLLFPSLCTITSIFCNSAKSTVLHHKKNHRGTRAIDDATRPPFSLRCVNQ